MAFASGAESTANRRNAAAKPNAAAERGFIPPGPALRPAGLNRSRLCLFLTKPRVAIARGVDRGLPLSPSPEAN